MNEMDAKIGRLETSLRAYGDEIAEIIAIDVPQYMLKMARKAFIEHVEFAEGMDDATLRFFKTKLQELGQQTAKSLRDTLSEPKLWLNVENQSSGKTLEGNVEVAKELANISMALQHFLDSEGLAYELEPYHTPARFIEGKYLPGVIEKYWHTHLRYCELLSQKREQSIQDRRSIQAARWDNG